MGILTKAMSTLARGLGLTDPRLYQYLSGGPTAAGESVTVDTAMQLDTVWACIRLVSQTVATLPLFFYTRDAKGRGVINDQHPLYRILHDRPNADMTATEFWETMMAAVLLWGNAYGAIERSGQRIVAVTPMRPDRVTIMRQEDGSLLYRYAYQGFVAKLEEADVLHIKGFSLDGLVGISPIAQGRQGIATAIAAEKAAGSFFRNGMRPSAIMSAPGFMTDDQRKRYNEEFVPKFTGAINSGKIPLMEGGFKLEQLQMPPEDAQLLATRAFHVEQLCRWFDVPPAMIGHTEKSTAWGTGMEQMMLWFLTFSLRPHLKRIEQAIHRDLLTPLEQTVSYVEFSVEGLLRADSHGRAALYAVLAQNGLRTRNELRALDNEAPLTGGDDLTVMSNLLPIDLLGEFVRGRRDNPLDPGFVPPKPAVPSGTQNPPTTQAAANTN